MSPLWSQLAELTCHDDPRDCGFNGVSGLTR